jgi:hypothetical protein
MAVVNDQAADISISAEGMDLLRSIEDGVGAVVLDIATDFMRRRGDGREVTGADVREAIVALKQAFEKVQGMPNVSEPMREASMKALQYLASVG